jgi:hypothetical protein
MFRAETHADQSGGNAPENGKTGDEPERPGGHERAVAGKDGFDHSILKQELHPLCHLRRPGAPLLHQPEICGRHRPSP